MPTIIDIPHKALTPLPSWDVRVQELFRAFRDALAVPKRDMTEIRLFYNLE
jgi:hypothetical protein